MKRKSEEQEQLEEVLEVLESLPVEDYAWQAQQDAKSAVHRLADKMGFDL